MTQTKFKKLVDRGYSFAVNSIMKDNNRDPSSSVLVAGSGRSGTTWLAELINRNNDFRLIFEPFNNNRISEMSSLGERLFIPAESGKECAFGSRIEKVLNGQFRHYWSDMFNRRVRVDRRLIKVIRANFFLRWIKSQFPGVKIIFVLRHPFAVAMSRQKLGFGTNIDQILGQNQLLECMDVPFTATEISNFPSFAQHVFVWCLENQIVISQFRRDELVPVFYEELVTDGDAKMRRIFSSLDLGSWSGDVSDQPSKSAKTRTGIQLVEFSQVDPADKKLAWEIMTNFGIDRIYHPDVSANLIDSQDLLDQ